MRTIIVLAALVVVAMASTTDYAKMFTEFKAKYGRVYASESEGARRFQVFVENMKTAERLQASNPLATFGVNEFSDVAAAEFKVRHNAEKYYAKAVRNAAPAPVKNVVGLPASQDWRTKGAVTAVKNQGQCGSCWSFSTTGSIEGQWFLAGNKLVSLSEQEFVSCDTIDQGCNGGLMDDAFDWVVQNRNGEVVTEESYPYVSGSGTAPACDLTGKIVGAKIAGHQDIANDETTMATHMVAHGPLSIAVDATSWQTYTGGIMTNCESTQIDHGVLIVGFEGSGSIPYWIIKNSWGASWGESGYIRVQFGTDQCLITKYPTTSIVNGSIPPQPPGPPSTPTPPSPPAGATFTQKQCTDAACTQGCASQTFPQNTCLQLEGGGSATATCQATDLEMKTYMFSQDCTGFSIPETQPINQCLQDESGTYFENICSSSVSAGALSAKKLRVSKAVAHKLRRLRKH